TIINSDRPSGYSSSGACRNSQQPRSAAGICGLDGADACGSAEQAAAARAMVDKPIRANIRAGWPNLDAASSPAASTARMDGKQTRRAARQSPLGLHAQVCYGHMTVW